MISQWMHRMPPAALAAGFLLLPAAGCGNKAETSDQAIVVTEPGVNPSAGVATAPSSSTESKADKPAPTEAPKESSTPAAATKVEGWGTLKGRVIFGGEPPAMPLLVKQGDPSVKDAAVCAGLADPLAAAGRR